MGHPWTTDKQNCMGIIKTSFLHESQLSKFIKITMLFFYQFAILKVTVQWEGMWLKGEAVLTAGSRLTAPRVHLGTWGGHCHQGGEQ